MDFGFSKTIARGVLENYLQRAGSMADAVHSQTMEDDLRMVASVGAKFLGRAAAVWQITEDDEVHFAKAAAFARRVHAVDPEIICQACIFEAVYEEVERIPVPGWVFEAFGVPVERRCFSFGAMAGKVFGEVYRWGGASRGTVPDITQLEARMWFVYRARRYLEAGYEALHMGQPHMYGGRDKGYLACREVMERIRELGRQFGRRGLVLLDAHTHGISHGGRTLFDFNSRPFSPLNVREKVEEMRLVKNGVSRGGVSPSGWGCGTLPYLWEVDNYGGYAVGPERFGETAERARKGWWGYDDIGWFAHQSAAERDGFLEYAQRWTEAADEAAFFQVPLRRTLGRAKVKLRRWDGVEAEVDVYKANTPSARCPDGFGQEEAIKRLWTESPERHGEAGVVPVYERDAETGLDLPEVVVLVGTLQDALGEWRPNPSSELTRMRHVGGGMFEWNGVLRRAGEAEFFVAVGGTMTEIYRANGLSTGANVKVRSARDNARMRVRFDYMSKRIEVRGEVSVESGAVGGQAAGGKVLMGA